MSTFDHVAGNVVIAGEKVVGLGAIDVDAIRAVLVDVAFLHFRKFPILRWNFFPFQS